MKVACYVHPIVHALGPNFTYGHFEIFADLLHSLRRDAAADCLLIAGSRFFRRAAEQGARCKDYARLRWMRLRSTEK